MCCIFLIKIILDLFVASNLSSNAFAQNQLHFGAGYAVHLALQACCVPRLVCKYSSTYRAGTGNTRLY